MMDHNLQNASDAAYKRLIAEAYPSPKRDIHAAVMAQVTAEAAQSGRKAKILTPAFRNRFVKYGSIAACFVLLVTLGFRILPMMTKDAAMESAADMAPMQETAMVTADTAAYEDTEAVPKTTAGGDNGARIQNKSAALTEETEEEIAEEPAAAAFYSTVLTDSVTEEEIPDEKPEAEEAPILMMTPAAVVEEAAAEDMADTLAIEEAVEECVVEEAVAEECVEECIVEEAALQSGIPSFESELKLALTAEIDAETYTAWLTGHGYTSPESWSIAEFVTDHGIPRERFTELYNALLDSFRQTNPDAEIITYDLSELYPG